MGFASSVRNERAAGRETSCAVGVRVGRTGGAAVKQGGMGGIARLRTRGRRAAWGVFRAEREERGADAGEAASDSLGERGAEEDEAERDGAGRGAVAAQGARGRKTDERRAETIHVSRHKRRCRSPRGVTRRRRRGAGGCGGDGSECSTAQDAGGHRVAASATLCVSVYVY